MAEPNKNQKRVEESLVKIVEKVSKMEKPSRTEVHELNVACRMLDSIWRAPYASGYTNSDFKPLY